MAQYTEGQYLKGSDGRTYVVHNGVPVTVGSPSPIASPTLPGQLQAQQDTHTRTQQEIRQAEATAGYNTEKTKNEAAKSGIDAKAAQVDLNIKTGAPPGDITKTGAAYIATLPPGVGDLTKEMLNGNYKGSITTSRNPVVMQAALAAAHATNGNFDAGRYDERLALMKGITNPNSQLGALNTAIAHAGMLYDQAPKVAGTNAFGDNVLSTGANALYNWFHSGSPGVTQYQSILQKYGPESARAYGVNTGGEREAAQAPLSINLPLDAKQASLKTDMDLFAGKIASLAHQNDILGGNHPIDYLSPEAKAALMKIDPQGYDKFVAATGGSPHADYSGLVGGPGATLATQDYRTQFDPVAANTISTFIRKGVPYEDAANYATSHGYAPPDPKAYGAAIAFAKAHGGATNVEANKYVPTTIGEQLASSPLAAGFAGGITGATAGLSDVAGRALLGPEWDANRAALAATNPTADLLGNVVGGAAGMFGAGGAAGNLLRAGIKGGLARDTLALALRNPFATGVAGDAAYGGIYGASENPGNPLAGAGIGALTGAAGGAAGNLLAKGAGAALQGVTNPAVQRLSQAGIPLTVGEALGGGAKKAQDALTSVFGPGNMVARRYADGRQALNQAAFNQAGAPINASIFGVGQTGINALDAAKSRAYSEALDPISLNLNTSDFVDPMKGVMKGAQSIPAGDLPPGYAANAISRYVGNNILPDGTMTGADFQKAYRGLGRTANAASGKVEGFDVGQALGQAKDILSGTLADQNPEAYAGFLRANAANRNLNVLSSAVNAAKNQIGDNGEPLFTPAQLGTAATANARNLNGNIAAASGSRPFNQLAMDAQQVMSSKLPESGTFPRAIIGTALLTGGGGMFGGHEGGYTGAGEGALAPLAFLSLMGSRRGQSLLTSMLMNRTAADQLTGRMIARNPQIGGDILTAAGIPLLTGP
jgi:hypothetical protein